MLTDDYKVIRVLATNRILNIRRNPFQQHLSGKVDNSVIEFTQPIINFSANHYSKMICYNDDWHESILTSHMELMKLLSVTSLHYPFLHIRIIHNLLNMFGVGN